MDRSLPRQFIGLLTNWFAKCFVCVRWGSAFSGWFKILAGVRQGGILSPILFAVYMDPLIMQLRRQGLGCRLLNEFYGCLLYADDILLITPRNTVHAMHMMLRLCAKFAEDYDMKFNCGKSFAMRIGKRFNEKCVALQLDNKDIGYVRELKYLGIHVSAGLFLKFSVEHLRSKFYRTFNCIYSKSKASNSEMVTVDLLKSFCFPFLFFAVDAMSLSSSNIRILESCINRALFRIFGSCDKSSLDYIKTCTGLHNIKAIVDRRHCSFIDKLFSDVSYSNLLLVYGFNSLCSL